MTLFQLICRMRGQILRSWGAWFGSGESWVTKKPIMGIAHSAKLAVNVAPFSVTLHSTIKFEGLVRSIMSKFGETLRQLREAQNLGLRETASMVSISPAYLSRIERGKEHPPKPEIIKAIARVLAADPDVLFRLCPSTDPDVVALLKERPKILELVRLVMSQDLSDEQVNRVEQFIKQDLLGESSLKDIVDSLCSSSLSQV
jgi:HTH-type transcriptional regulator, competence development regulator